MHENKCQMVISTISFNPVCKVNETKDCHYIFNYFGKQNTQLKIFLQKSIDNDDNYEKHIVNYGLNIFNIKISETKRDYDLIENISFSINANNLNFFVNMNTFRSDSKSCFLNEFIIGNWKEPIIFNNNLNKSLYQTFFIVLDNNQKNLDVFIKYKIIYNDNCKIKDSSICCSKYITGEWNKTKKIAIVSFESLDLFYLQKNVENFKIYCERHGYDLKYYISSKYNCIHTPMWSRLLQYNDVLNEDYEAIFCVDSDVVIWNKTQKLETYLEKYPNKSFFFSTDPPWVNTYFSIYPGKLCLGVFLMRKTNKMKEMFNELFNYYYNTSIKLWVKDGGGVGGWSPTTAWGNSDAFGQGLLVNHFLNNKYYNTEFHTLNYWTFFNLLQATWNNSFLIHFSGQRFFILDFLNKINKCPSGFYIAKNISLSKNVTVDCWECPYEMNCKECLNQYSCTSCDLEKNFEMVGNKCVCKFGTKFQLKKNKALPYPIKTCKQCINFESSNNQLVKLDCMLYDLNSNDHNKIEIISKNEFLLFLKYNFKNNTSNHTLNISFIITYEQKNKIPYIDFLIFPKKVVNVYKNFCYIAQNTKKCEYLFKKFENEKLFEFIIKCKNSCKFKLQINLNFTYLYNKITNQTLMINKSKNSLSENPKKSNKTFYIILCLSLCFCFSLFVVILYYFKKYLKNKINNNFLFDTSSVNKLDLSEISDMK